MSEVTQYMHLGAADGATEGGADAVLGAKGAWLQWLAEAGESVPAGFVVPVAALSALVEGRACELSALKRSLSWLASEHPSSSWAVRASPMESRPGLLPTVLDRRTEEQVLGALEALYRRSVEAGLRCAAVVQRRVEAGPDGWAAAAFTRDPTLGAPGVTGEWSPAGEGRDVVGGQRRLPALDRGAESLRAVHPSQFDALAQLAARLEHRAGRILELELVHDGQRLWVLQARPVARHAAAAVRLACERVHDQTLALDLRPRDAADLSVERVVVHGAEPLARGLAASPGVASGVPVQSAEAAIALADGGRDVLLLRNHADPEDIPGMRAARGVLTSMGGLTCHAAVMARGLGRPAVVGCAALQVTSAPPSLAGHVLDPDTVLTLDGYEGAVYLGELERTRVPTAGRWLTRLLEGLARRRTCSLWLRDPPAAIRSQLSSFYVDGVLWSDPPGEEIAGTPTWKVQGPDAVKRLGGGEGMPLHKGVDPGTPLPAAEHPTVLWIDTAPPAGRVWSTSDMVVAVPTDLWLAWAFALDSITDRSLVALD